MLSIGATGVAPACRGATVRVVSEELSDRNVAIILIKELGDGDISIIVAIKELGHTNVTVLFFKELCYSHIV